MSSLKSSKARYTPSVAFTEEERIRLIEAAKHCGFATGKQSGVTRYIREVVLGHDPPSVFDQEVMVELCRLHAGMGRIGGLLKLAVAEGADLPELRVCVRELLAVKDELKELIRDIREGNGSA